MHGAIRGLWSQLGWERSFLGYPLTNDGYPDGSGLFQPLPGRLDLLDGGDRRHEVQATARSAGCGPSSAGNAASSATRPRTSPGPLMESAANHFQGGSIYWTPTTSPEGAGAIRGLWSQLGWERSFLGSRHGRNPRRRTASAASTTSRAARSTDPHHRGARGARRDPRTLVPARLERSFLGYPISNEMACRRRHAAEACSSTAHRLVRRRWSRRGPRADPPAREGAHHPNGSHHDHVAGGDADRVRRRPRW